MVGGHTTGFIPTSTAEYYHGGRWRPIQQLYSHDGGFRVRLADGRWMVAGGFEKYLGIGQSYAVEVYDSTARSFSPLPIMEEKRAMARGISLGRDGGHQRKLLFRGLYGDIPTGGRAAVGKTRKG